jgi:uncharacterized membrane protein YvbJ
MEVFMDTEVYLLCGNCNGITEGIGSGDLRDTVQCKRCGHAFTARTVGWFESVENNTVKKRLYVVEDKFNIF